MCWYVGPCDVTRRELVGNCGLQMALLDVPEGQQDLPLICRQSACRTVAECGRRLNRIYRAGTHRQETDRRVRRLQLRLVVGFDRISGEADEIASRRRNRICPLDRFGTVREIGWGLVPKVMLRNGNRPSS